MRDTIIDHLYSKKLIRDTQHGFTQRRSCLTNLLKFLEEVTAYVDEGSLDVLYLDFSNAFFLLRSLTFASLQHNGVINCQCR